jgi:hypothetical protein
MERISQMSVTYQEDWETQQWSGEGSVQRHKTIQTDADGSNPREVTYVTATILLSSSIPPSTSGEQE